MPASNPFDCVQLFDRMVKVTLVRHGEKENQTLLSIFSQKPVGVPVTVAPAVVPERLVIYGQQTNGPGASSVGRQVWACSPGSQQRKSRKIAFRIKVFIVRGIFEVFCGLPAKNRRIVFSMGFKYSTNCHFYKFGQMLFW